MSFNARPLLITTTAGLPGDTFHSFVASDASVLSQRSIEGIQNGITLTEALWNKNDERNYDGLVGMGRPFSAAHFGGRTKLGNDKTLRVQPPTALDSRIGYLPAELKESRDIVHALPWCDSHWTRLEIEAGVIFNSLEPQVQWACHVLAAKGYLANNSGFRVHFDVERYEAGLELCVDAHTIDSFVRFPTTEEIAIIESVEGARFEVYENAIAVDPEGRSLQEIADIFNEVARRLPDRSQAMRERMAVIDGTLAEDNKSFIMIRELRNHREYYVKRHQYLEVLVSFLNAVTATTGVTVLYDSILNSEDTGGLSEEEQLDSVMTHAIGTGHALCISAEDIEYFGDELRRTINHILLNPGVKLNLNGVEMEVHPGFRLVFFLDKKETLHLQSTVGVILPQVECPQHGIDISKSLYHMIRNSVDLGSFKNYPSEEFRHLSRVHIRNNISDRYHRGDISKDQALDELEAMYRATLTSAQFLVALECSLAQMRES